MFSRSIFDVISGILPRDLATIVSEYVFFEGVLDCILEDHNDWVLCLTALPEFVDDAISLAGRLVSGSDDMTIRIWDVTTRTSRVLKGHTRWVHSLAVLPDGCLVSGSDDRTIRMWNVMTGASRVLGRHDSCIYSLAVLPDGQLASGSADRTIRIWNVLTGISQVLKGHIDIIRCLVVLPDGRLASGSGDTTIRIWDIPTGTFLQTNLAKRCQHSGTPEVLRGHTNTVRSLTVLSDGRLASGSADKTIRIWDITTGTSHVLEKQTGRVFSLAILPDGRLASGSGDTTIRIWS